MQPAWLTHHQSATDPITEESDVGMVGRRADHRHDRADGIAWTSRRIG
jgi:hypothetical protein